MLHLLQYYPENVDQVPQCKRQKGCVNYRKVNVYLLTVLGNKSSDAIT